MSTTQATNGYMIRLEVLKMAKEMAEQDYHATRENLIREYNSSRETFPGDEGPRDPKPWPNIPAFPTSSDITSKAAELYTFITTK